jgi:hypothetical protein
MAVMTLLAACAAAPEGLPPADPDAPPLSVEEIEAEGRALREAEAEAVAELPPPEYLGIRTALLDEDLVSFRLTMRGVREPAQIDAYAACAAAQYALIRGYGYARHVRTLVDERAGNWHADAIYTISEALPRGSATIDADVTVSDCSLNGIPTV